MALYLDQNTMRSFRIARRAIVTVAALMIGIIPLGVDRAATVSTVIVTPNLGSNDVVDRSTVQIFLGFDVPVDHQKSTLTLKSPQGDRQLKPRLESAPNYLFSIAGNLAPGAYELAWQARLPGGQTQSGIIPFMIASRRASVSDKHASRTESERQQAPDS